MRTSPVHFRRLRLLAAAALLALLVPPAGAFQITLTPPLTPIVAGDSFSILVTAKDLFASNSGDTLIAYGFDVATGGGAALTGASVAVGFLDDTALTGVDVSASAFPGLADPGGSFDLLLSELTLTALVAGPLSVTLSTDTLDPFQGLFFALGGQLAFSETLNLQIQPAAAPLPGTALLLGAGLLALNHRRRR
jgi:hypothetical protein